MGELCHYDDETGQLLTGSFMDYAMPRADEVPSFAVEISEVPSPTNPLGIVSMNLKPASIAVGTS